MLVWVFHRCPLPGWGRSFLFLVYWVFCLGVVSKSYLREQDDGKRKFKFLRCSVAAIPPAPSTTPAHRRGPLLFVEQTISPSPLAFYTPVTWHCLWFPTHTILSSLAVVFFPLLFLVDSYSYVPVPPRRHLIQVMLLSFPLLKSWAEWTSCFVLLWYLVPLPLCIVCIYLCTHPPTKLDRWGGVWVRVWIWEPGCPDSNLCLTSLCDFCCASVSSSIKQVIIIVPIS